MEKTVEKVYDDMLEEIKSVNDEFINNYFENNEFDLENQEETENDSEENEQENDSLIVENPVDNDIQNLTNTDNCLENIEIMPVENLEDMVISVEKKVEEPEENDDLSDEYEMKIEELKLEPEEDSEEHDTDNDDSIINETSKTIEDYSNEELINLIDETDSSEEFFNKLGC